MMSQFTDDELLQLLNRRPLLTYKQIAATLKVCPSELKHRIYKLTVKGEIELRYHSSSRATTLSQDDVDRMRQIAAWRAEGKSWPQIGLLEGISRGASRAFYIHAQNKWVTSYASREHAASGEETMARQD